MLIEFLGALVTAIVLGLCVIFGGMPILWAVVSWLLTAIWVLFSRIQELERRIKLEAELTARRFDLLSELITRLDKQA